jgi:hypothetical protein
MYLVFSVFTSKPTSLLASIKVCVFFFMVSTLSPSLSTLYVVYICRWGLCNDEVRSSLYGTVSHLCSDVNAQSISFRAVFSRGVSINK